MAGSLLGMTVLIFMILIMSGILLFSCVFHIVKQAIKCSHKTFSNMMRVGYMLNMTEGNLLELEQIDGKFHAQ